MTAGVDRATGVVMALAAPAGGFGELLHRAQQGLDDAGRVLDARAVELLSGYLDAVITWGRQVDLTAARSPEELVDLTLADAAVIGRHEPGQGLRIVDVGSGAGAPGLVVAMLRPDWDVTLVEPRAKRVAFLRHVIGRLALSVAVKRARSDALPDGTYDMALSRATLPPRDWLTEGTRLSSGAVWVLLAREEPPSCPGWIGDEHAYTWPLTGVKRRAVRYRRSG